MYRLTIGYRLVDGGTFHFHHIVAESWVEAQRLSFEWRQNCLTPGQQWYEVRDNVH